jgi:hypothetical protein
MSQRIHILNQHIHPREHLTAVENFQQTTDKMESQLTIDALKLTLKNTRDLLEQNEKQMEGFTTTVKDIIDQALTFLDKMQEKSEEMRQGIMNLSATAVQYKVRKEELLNKEKEFQDNLIQKYSAEMLPEEGSVSELLRQSEQELKGSIQHLDISIQSKNEEIQVTEQLMYKMQNDVAKMIQIRKENIPALLLTENVSLYSSQFREIQQQYLSYFVDYQVMVAKKNSYELSRLKAQTSLNEIQFDIKLALFFDAEQKHIIQCEKEQLMLTVEQAMMDVNTCIFKTELDLIEDEAKKVKQFSALRKKWKAVKDLEDLNVKEYMEVKDTVDNLKVSIRQLEKMLEEWEKTQDQQFVKILQITKDEDQATDSSVPVSVHCEVQQKQLAFKTLFTSNNVVSNAYICLTAVALQL